MTPDNSTNVRIRLPRWFAAGLALSAAIAPRWTAARVIDRMLRTRRRGSSAVADTFRAESTRVTLALGETGALAFVTGEGPRVYLLHGWDGSAGDFVPLATALAAAGYQAIVLDAPGHGAAPGDASNVVLMARSLEAAVEACGPAAAVVAHSFGAAAASLAIARGLRAGRVVMLAPEPEPVAYVDSFGQLGGAGFRDEVRAEMGRRVGLAPSEVGFEATLGERRPLVVHDLRDRQVPFARVLHAVPRVLRTDGLGHRRVLSHRAVIRAVLDYVRDGTERSCSHGYVDGACATCALEQELYRPSLRAVS